MDRGTQLWHRFWSFTWWIKAPALLMAALVSLGIVGAAVGGGGESEPTSTQTETIAATATAIVTQTPHPTVTLTSTDTPIPTATATAVPTATTPPVNRMDCHEIRGTPYRSDDERAWFLSYCVTPSPTPRSCHPSYHGACLDPNASDYDCEGGPGDGPRFTGPVTVVGPDVFDLDRDGDGWGCENSPPPQQQPPPQQPTQTSNCDPSYPDVCIPIGAADYDCAGGSGNGPNYIQGPIRVLPPDPHGLDRDGDGIGCES